MIEEIIGQILSIVAPVLTLITYQLNHKRTMFIVLTGATISTCLSYLFLGATSGFALNIVCICRNVALLFQTDGGKGRYYHAVGFSAAMVVLGILSWQGGHSLLIIAALTINTVAMSIASPQWLRKSILLTSTLVLIYNFIEFSIGGMINEAIAIFSAVVGIMRFGQRTGKS